MPLGGLQDVASLLRRVARAYAARLPACWRLNITGIAPRAASAFMLNTAAWRLHLWETPPLYACHLQQPRH